MQNEVGWQGVAAGLTPAVSWCWLLMYLKMLRPEQTRWPGRTQTCPCQRLCLSPTGQMPFPGQSHPGAMLPGARAGAAGAGLGAGGSGALGMGSTGRPEAMGGGRCVCCCACAQLGEGVSARDSSGCEGEDRWVGAVGVHGTVCHCVGASLGEWGCDLASRCRSFATVSAWALLPEPT